MKGQYKLDVIELLNMYSRGLNAALGSGCGILNELSPVQTRLHPENGYAHVIDEIVSVAKNLQHSDILASCSVVFARAQGRTVSQEDFLRYGYPENLRPRTRMRLIKSLERRYEFSVDEADIIGSSVSEKEGLIDLLPENPNRICYEISSAVLKKCSVRIDSEITDTTAGYAGVAYIGMPTIGATPLGATKGINLKNALRVAVAADFLMGSGKGIPLVKISGEKESCQTWRTIERKDIGKFRYDGRIDARKEGVGIAL